MPPRQDPSIRYRPLGFIEVATNCKVVGWVWDEFHPNLRQLVDILVNEQIVVRVNADRFRKDLLEMNFGDGKYGFEFAFPSPIPSPYTIKCRVEKMKYALRMRTNSTADGSR